MNAKIDRKNVVAEITKAAKNYKQNLVGKTFLYVFDNRYIEVMFKAKDFKHLTGVDTNLSAQDFYKKAHNGTLQASQIFFSSRHPYKLAQKKLNHLQNIATLAMGKSFMLENISTDTASYKYGATDLNFSLCFNKEYNSDGIEQDNYFIVESLRDGDSISKSDSVFAITHAYVKANNVKKYDQEIYCEQNHSVHTLPTNIKDLLSEHLTNDVPDCPVDMNNFSPETAEKTSTNMCEHDSDNICPDQILTTSSTRFDNIINQKVCDESYAAPTNHFGDIEYD